MLAGMIAISIAVGLTSAVTLWVSGAGFLAAFLYGYVGGGLGTMAGIALAIAACPFVKRHIQALHAGAARNHAESARNR
ncbi:hypothetical protein [Paracoccus zeaxanthinifaciens]|uniref:hypothetical protein n=1 Tax=Paracoccus zeaxanthinifaciens TaxID=187400 RepID=UPI0012EC8705|nr:hypothetical protein [Paracoccus zeaxanthinifaciens]